MVIINQSEIIQMRIRCLTLISKWTVGIKTDVTVHRMVYLSDIGVRVWNYIIQMVLKILF